MMFGDLDQRLKGLFEHHGDARGTGGVPAAGPVGPPASGRVIREIMDPRFLHEQLLAVQQTAKGQPAGSQLSDDTYREAFAELEAASAHHAAEAPFMPRTPTVSIFQSTLSTCIESRAGQLLKDVPKGLEGIAHAVLSTGNVYREFGPCDPLWIETKISEGLAMLEHRPPFPSSPAPPMPLPEDARVIVVGDWGSGLPGASAVAQQMAEHLEPARGRDQHVIHLGDVYYSGWREEYETRFLPHWPVKAGDSEVLSWALNGNHDMYSGGHGYFGFLLRDPRFRGQWLPESAHQQSSSYFSLENDHWQILGLDSAYLDRDLAGDQAAWVGRKLGPVEPDKLDAAGRKQPDAGGRKTMLLTHHQPFSAYEDVDQALINRLLPELNGRVLDAWLWGHEHRCAVYASQPTDYLKFGSCIGHGGVPRLLPDPTPKATPKLTWALDAEEREDGNRWGRFGFAILDFQGPEIHIRYIDETGQINHEEHI
jgi:hypothetical protein